MVREQNNEAMKTFKPRSCSNLYYEIKQQIHKQNFIHTKPNGFGTCVCHRQHEFTTTTIIKNLKSNRTEMYEERLSKQNERHRYNSGIQVQRNNFTPYHDQENKPVLMEVDNSRQFIHPHNFNQRKQQRINKTFQTEVESTVPRFKEQYKTGSTFLRRGYRLPSIQTKCGITGTPVTILVDTASTNNYISFNCKIGEPVPINTYKNWILIIETEENNIFI